MKKTLIRAYNFNLVEVRRHFQFCQQISKIISTYLEYYIKFLIIYAIYFNNVINKTLNSFCYIISFTNIKKMLFLQENGVLSFLFFYIDKLMVSVKPPIYSLKKRNLLKNPSSSSAYFLSYGNMLFRLIYDFVKIKVQSFINEADNLH